MSSTSPDHSWIPKDIGACDGGWIEQDKLERQEFVKQACTDIARLPKHSRLAIEGPWGSGKTTVLGFLIQELEAQQIRCVLINAWESSYASDPLVAVIAGLSEAIQPLGEQNTIIASRLERLREQTSAAVRGGRRLFLSNVLDRLTGGIVDAELIDTVHDQSKTIPAFDALEEFESTRRALHGVCEALKKLGGALQQSGTRLVLFVDELDRCDPDYALRFLERSAHVLTACPTPVVFAIDRQQMGMIVRARYGQGVAADAYLQRFFQASLPIPSRARRSGDFFAHLFHACGLDQVLHLPTLDQGDRFAELVLLHIPDALGMTPRQQQRLVTQLCHLNEHEDLMRYSSSLVLCLVFLLALDLRGSGLHAQLLDGSLTAESFLTGLRRFDPELVLYQEPIGQAFLAILFANFLRSHFPDALLLLESSSSPLREFDRAHCERVYKDHSEKRARSEVEIMKRILGVSPGT